MSRDVDEIEFHVSVTGVAEAKAETDAAAISANQATVAMGNTAAQARNTIRPLIMTVRSVNAARLAIQQTSKAITELSPTALMYGFLNMIQVVYNLTSLMGYLKNATGAAASAQAILAVLTARWWLIPLALAAGALVYSRIQSFQAGGYIPETGVYVLHKGEYVVPSRNIAYNSFGPIFVSLPTAGLAASLDMREIVRTLGPEIVRKSRRGS